MLDGKWQNYYIKFKFWRNPRAVNAQIFTELVEMLSTFLTLENLFSNDLTGYKSSEVFYFKTCLTTNVVVPFNQLSLHYK